MENNQQRKEERNSSGNNEATSFDNQQPGQQVTTGKEQGRMNETTESSMEQHSESSKPERENETLGTP